MTDYMAGSALRSDLSSEKQDIYRVSEPGSERGMDVWEGGAEWTGVHRSERVQSHIWPRVTQLFFCR